MQRLIRILRHYVERPWYPLLLAVLAAMDHFVVVIPTDGILVSSAVCSPRHWVRVALGIGLGSTLGAMVLAGLVDQFGISMIQNFYPGYDETTTWLYTVEFFSNYGLIVIFFIALSPFAQQPAIVLAVLSRTPMLSLLLAVLAGRLIKALTLAWLASHTPKVLERYFGINVQA